MIVFAAIVLFLLYLLGLIFAVIPGISGILFISIGNLIFYFLFPGKFSLIYVITGFGLFVLGEVLEQTLGAINAKMAKASKWSIVLSIALAIMFGILLNFVIAVIGTFIGVLFGTFIGCFLGEIIIYRKGGSQSFRAGLAAFTGRFFSVIIKLSFAFILVIWGIIAIFS